MKAARVQALAKIPLKNENKAANNCHSDRNYFAASSAAVLAPKKKRKTKVKQLRK